VITHSEIPGGLELLSAVPAKPTGKPPLLFVHGTNAGAWIWAEGALQRAAEAGYPAHAVSLRGHGNSAGRDQLHSFGLAHALADVRAAVAHLDDAPVLIGLSMGAAVAARLLVEESVSAGILMASVPPTGLMPMTARLALLDPIFVSKVSMVQAYHDAVPGAKQIVRSMVFSDAMPLAQSDQLFLRWQPESRALIQDLTIRPLNPFMPRRTPVHVMGFGADRLVDWTAVMETAVFFGCEPKLWPRRPHLAILEPGWEQILDHALAWIERTFEVKRERG